jgi:hypothetical protein
VTRPDRRYGYRWLDAALIRVATRADELALPPWPVAREQEEVTLAAWRAWLHAAWADPLAAEGVEVASPVLAASIEAILAGSPVDVRKARRAALSVCCYLIRSRCRSTPFGMFGGVALASFGSGTAVLFGEEDQIAVRPGSEWVEAVLLMLERHHELLRVVEVCASNLCRTKDGRVEVPVSYAADVSVRLTPAVALVLEAATSPLPVSELAGKLEAEFPDAPPDRIQGLLTALLEHRVLVSALHASATIPDRVGYVLEVLEQAGADELPDLSEFVSALRTVRELASGLTFEHDPAVRRRGHQDARAVMDAVVPGAEARLDVDLRLDGHVRLSAVVAEVLETAAGLLARVAACPLGTPAWREYAERFAERYGEDRLVGVTELTDLVSGLGYPSDYLDVEVGPRLSRRDRMLLDLAGRAAQDGVTHVHLSDAMLRSLDETALRDRRWTAHLEVTAQVLAASAVHLDRGDFRVRIESVSRAVGTMTGRFLPLLDAGDQQRLAGTYVGLPTIDPDAMCAQLSFGVAKAAADPLARTRRIMPRVISIGEFPPVGEGVIPLSDLAVGIQDGQLFLAQISTGCRIEAIAPTALNFRLGVFVPPIARFLAEVSRSGRTQVTGFEWGIAGWLPFTPELRAGRIILAPACWRLKRDELPGRSASFGEWAGRLHEWRTRRKVPPRVLLTEGDQYLLLDLDQDAHLDVLRAEIDKTGVAILADAPPADGFGWIGGRAHSLVVPMALQVPARRPQ